MKRKMFLSLFAYDLLDISTSVGEQDKQFSIINMSRHLCLAAAEEPSHFMRTKSKSTCPSLPDICVQAFHFSGPQEFNLHIRLSASDSLTFSSHSAFSCCHMFLNSDSTQASPRKIFTLIIRVHLRGSVFLVVSPGRSQHPFEVWRI